MARRRTDIHSPGNFDPGDYVYVGSFDRAAPDYRYLWRFDPEKGVMVREELPVTAGSRRELRRLLADHGFTGGNWEMKGSCDHCGARIRYVVVYRHEPTGEHIAVGEICARERMSLGNRHEYDFKRLVSEAHREKKDRELLTRKDDYLSGDGFELVSFLARENARRYRPFYDDLLSYFERVGNLTEGQEAAVRRAIEKKEERRRQRAEERENGEPVPSAGERIEVTGKIASVRRDYGAYGAQWKMMVVEDRGFRLWGTMPRALHGCEPGDRVRFAAQVRPSDDDLYFGYFSRPTQAESIPTSDNAEVEDAPSSALSPSLSFLVSNLT